MNFRAIVGLIADLYTQILALQEQVQQLEAQLAETKAPDRER